MVDFSAASGRCCSSPRTSRSQYSDAGGQQPFHRVNPPNQFLRSRVQLGVSIPRDHGLDSTFALLNEGYNFIGNRCRKFHSDIFLTRVMGQRAVCIHGREAAKVFYDETEFQRAGALPRRVVTSLFGKNAIHTLDGDAHHRRKTAFLSLMSPANLERLMTEMAQYWRAAVREWPNKSGIVLFDEAAQILTQGACAWAGVPLKQSDVAHRSRDFVSMVDSFGGVGPRLWRGKLARMRIETWIAAIISDARRSSILMRPDSALAVMSGLRDVNGKLLDARTAAVELINVIRPTVAIAWYIAFAGLALHENPDWKQKIANEPVSRSAGSNADLFMQEVRRFFPFAPFLGALVKRPFEWNGYRFERGTMVLLDVYGTNHDPDLWQAPDEFRPERFVDWKEDAFSLIPQGGGDRMGHRCPGEWITMHNVTLALHFLTRCMTYDVAPGQDLTVDLTRMPTGPKSGLVLQNIRTTAILDAPMPSQPSGTAAEDAAQAA